MKKKLLVLFSLASIFANATSSQMTANVGQSTIDWIGEKVTGEHHGKIMLSSGSVELEDGNIVSGNFKIDMTTLTCGDLTGENAEKLIGHLESPDFFNVKKYPTAKIVFKKVVIQPKKGYKVIADLTIKGIKKEISFMAMLKDKGDIKLLEADLVIDRSEFNIKYGSASFFDNLKDKVIYDEFKINASIVLK